MEREKDTPRQERWSEREREIEQEWKDNIVEGNMSQSPKPPNVNETSSDYIKASELPLHAE